MKKPKQSVFKTKHPEKLRIVAIDGPSGSGKSTLAKALAKKLGLECLDTGAMYRAVAYAVLQNGCSPEDAIGTVKISKKSRISVEPDKVELNGEDITLKIRSPEVTNIVSKIAANPKIRKHQRKHQRKWVRKKGGGVLEGRDIGTVILPKADIKVYIDASPEIRAERRAKESGREVAEVLESMKNRDEQDSARKFNPLKKAEGAIVADTSLKSVDEVVDEILLEQQKRYEAWLSYGRDPGGTYKPTSKFSLFFLRRGAYVIFKIYFRGKVYDRKKIPKSGAVIYAPAGHRSNLDTPAVGSISIPLLKYMAKDSLYLKNRFWSRFIYFWGGFPVKRDQQDMTALRIARKVLERGDPLLLFPEGGRQEGPDVKPLLGGVMWLSAKTGAPILPIGVAGGDEAMPIGRKIPFPKKIVICVGELIPAPEKTISKPTRKAKTEELRERLQELFDQAKAARQSS